MNALLERARPLILIVDDEIINTRLLARFLEGDYDLDVVHTGEDALRRASLLKPNLILLDIGLPDVSGFEICRSIKQQREFDNTPIIFVSVESESEDELYGFQVGAADYLCKPVSEVLVKVRVAAHLNIQEKNLLLERSNKELLEANVELLHQQEILHAVADLATELTFYQLTDGSLSYISPSCEQLLGYPAASLMQQPLQIRNTVEYSDLSLWDDLFALKHVERLKTLLPEHRIRTHELYMYHQNGQKMRVKATACPVFNGKGTLLGFRAAIVDVTAAHKMTLELREAKIKAEEGSRAKAQFLSTMSHELRTPLNGVLGILDILGLEPRFAEHVKLIQTAKQSALTLLELIESILTFTQEDPDQASHYKRFSLNDLLVQVTMKFQPMAREKGITLQFEPVFLNGSKSIYLEGLPNQIEMVLSNLLSNAVKFTLDRGRVTLSVQQIENGQWCLQVEDTGPGMSKDQQQRIFEPFVQLSEGHAREYDGAGLGLALCRRVVERLGGDISLTSEVNKGSCFKVLLPMKTMDSPCIHCLDWEAEGFSGPLEYSLQKQLECLGFKVHCLASGKSLEAFDQFPMDDFYLVFVRKLTDETLNQLKEYQSCKQLARLWVAAEQVTEQQQLALKKEWIGVLLLPVEIRLLERSLNVSTFHSVLAAS